MRNDPYFKILAIVIFAGVVFSCFDSPLSAATASLHHIRHEAIVLLARV